MSVATRPDPAAVLAAVGGVPDPELPVVTLAQLGMVHRVEVLPDGAVEVDLLPTFSGCPATDMMGRDVVSALAEVDGVDPSRVRIRWLFSPVWTTDRIAPEGHERLRSFGIAPPTGGGVVSGAARPDGRAALPLVVGASTARDPDASPDVVACPYCDGTDVTEDSPFGPTPCRASWHCATCNQPFERFKPL